MVLTSVQIISDVDPEYVMNAIVKSTDGWSTSRFKIHFSTSIPQNGRTLYSALIEYYAEIPL